MLANLIALENLEPDRNNLTHIPLSINALIKLKRLSIGFNQLKNVDIINLPSLTSLYLTGNNLTNLPGNIGKSMNNLELI